MAAPTLETNATADTLRILSGTPGDPVTWNDVWDWDDGGGSSGGDGDVPKDGGGTAKVSTFMTETVADAVYLILKNIDFGDDVSPTYFQSRNEMVYFADDMKPQVKDNATFIMGELQGAGDEEWGVKGSTWSVSPDDTTFIGDGSSSVVNIFDSRLHIRSEQEFYFWDGTVDLRNSTFSGVFDIGSHSRCDIEFGGSLDSVTIKKCYFTNLSNFKLRVNPDVLEDVHVHFSDSGVAVKSASGIESTGVLATDVSIDILAINADDSITVINPEKAVSTVDIINGDDTWIKEAYTCNIHIADKDGADLAGVVVDCEDTNGDAVWAAGTIVTDAAGDIAEQVITYKKWEGTDETLTEYSPHKFTISKAGYETLVLDNITIDSPIVWHEELQDSGSQRPRFRMHGA